MASHRFAPQHYHTTIGPHAPVMHLAPGDSCATTTVDARGCDASGQQVTARGNPMTGPFYVDGAAAGDTLVVRFDSLRPNRPRGWTRPRIAANVLEPGYCPDLAVDVELEEWDVDAQAGTATLVAPPTRLAGVAWPLSPMLGCFGVCPPGGQTIATSTSGTYGGNMDYRGFGEGVTVFLPVFVDGALFHLGDGHAIQGDGEIVGTGVEISFDVTFSVDLLRGQSIGWPRAESAGHIMAAGNARPLDQALQHATTEMLRWLQGDYGLDPLSAHALMGQCVEYDVGNVFDPAYTMVCKISRSALTRLGIGRGG